MIAFLSDREPTADQIALVRDYYEAELVHLGNVPLERGRVVETICPQINCHVIAVVAPFWAILELIRAGYTVIEFVSIPSGECRGMWVHRPSQSSFVQPREVRCYF